MISELKKSFHFKSSDNDIRQFIEDNGDVLIILDAIKPQLHKHFPSTIFSLEVSDEIAWTSETKLLLNVHVGEEMFFNGMLNHFNAIYSQIKPLIENTFSPIVLFPHIENEEYDKITSNSTINLIARTSYFNNDYCGGVESEMLIRDAPKDLQKPEIIQYCQDHDDIFAPDIEKVSKLDFFDICEVLDELESEGMICEIKTQI